MSGEREVKLHADSQDRMMTRATPIRIMAATSATVQEIALAKARGSDGTKPVKTEKPPYRPKEKSTYFEPTYFPDDDDLLEEVLNTDRTLWKHKAKVGPRDPDDIIHYDETKHGDAFRARIQWRDCPEDQRPRFEATIKKYWDAFALEGVGKPIRGFRCVIDTGTSAPITCKTPRYGPHETRVINKLTRELEARGMIEDCESPWGSQIVLAAKPDQDHKHWSEFVWRLCVSYRKVNTVVRPFVYPTRRCDDAIRDIGKSKFFITLDLEMGYWQVLLDILSRDKLAFFCPDGKKRWTRMPMGYINSHGIFCAIVDYLRKETNIIAEERNITNNYDVTLEGDKPWTNQEGIVDDIFIHSEDNDTLHSYFEVFLEVCVRYRITINLKKTRFLPQSAEFVGVDVEAQGNRPASSKMPQLAKLKDRYGALNDLKETPPLGVGDVRSLIGMLGFYQEYMPNLELRVTPFREVIKLKLEQAAKQGERRQTKYGAPFGSEILLGDDWTQEHQKLADELLDELQTRPTLARPDYTRRFYLKTDWSRFGMAAVLLQADPDDEDAKAAEEAEEKGGPCLFDGAQSKLRLRPIAFISRKCTKREADDHSFTGEAATGGWAIEKFRRHLFGREFTWITDCSGLRQFFDGYDVPTHTHQRLRQRLLRYSFSVVHRSARFLVECDTLSRYNGYTAELKAKHDALKLQEDEVNGKTETKSNSVIRNMTFTVRPRQVRGQGKVVTAYAPIVRNANTDRTCWVYNAGTSTVMAGAREAGIALHPILIEDRTQWRSAADAKGYNTNEAEDLLTPGELENACAAWQNDITRPDWIVAHISEDRGEQAIETFVTTIQRARSVNVVIIFISQPKWRHEQQVATIEEGLKQMRLCVSRKKVEATDCGAPINSLFSVILATREQEVLDLLHVEREEPQPMKEWLDEPNKGSGTDFLLYLARQRLPTDIEQAHHPAQATVMATLDKRQLRWTAVFDVNHPAPSLHQTVNEWDGTPFLIQVDDDILQRGMRRIRRHEIARLVGMEGEAATRISKAPRDVAMQELKHLPPMQMIANLLEAMTRAEEAARIQAQPNPEAHIMIARAINLATTLPLPSTASWQLATAQDPDLAYLEHCLRTGEIPDKENFENKTWYVEWKDNRLEAEDHIVYRYETTKLVGLRAIRAKAVPRRFRQLVFAAMHVSPTGGHTGYHKTYWKVATRFYWPNMATDIRAMQMGCGHCRVVNNTSHEAQQQLRTIASDVPFDVIVLDIWHPGKSASTKTKTAHVLVTLDLLTAFAMGQFVHSLESSHIATTMFASCFSVTGLPKLVIIDSGSEFAGTLVQLCKSIGVTYHTVTRGNHKAILVERFNRYMNKAQRLHAANCETFQEWQLGTAFALYGWNSAPVDGTNIVRSYAAIGREFPFPIDVESESQPERNHQAQGQAVIDHVDAAFPMLAKQRLLLKILTEDRREHHRMLKNEGKNATIFQPGDIVMVRKEVQSSDEKGPAKARIRARGTYRVLEEEKPGTYFIQKIPFVEQQGRRRGKRLRESAARLERVPSTLVIHKTTDGMDTRMATFFRPMVTNPLENTLGPHQFGTYRQAPADRPYAFERIEDIWGEDDLPENGDSDDDEDSDSDDEGNEQGNNNEQVDEQNTAANEESTETNETGETTQKRTRTTTERREKATNDGEDPEGSDDSEVRRSKRTKRVPPRFHGTKFHHNIATRTRTRTQRTHELLQDIRQSRDKLVIIQYQMNRQAKQQWYVAQIQMQESEERADIEKGYYQVRFCMRHAQDSQTKTLRSCRYWPEVHRRRPDGTLGDIVMVRPGKTEKMLQHKHKYMIRQEELNLDKHILVGPFDYAIPREYNNQANRIPDGIWIDLIDAGRRRGIDTADLNQVIPLTARR